VLFQLMISAAPAAHIAPAGPPVLVVGAGVIEISAPGGLATHRAAAGHVPGDDELAQPRRRPVGRRLIEVGASSGRLICCRPDQRPVHRSGGGAQRGAGDR